MILFDAPDFTVECDTDTEDTRYIAQQLGSIMGMYWLDEAENEPFAVMVDGQQFNFIPKKQDK